jgi:hypothetical protein
VPNLDFRESNAVEKLLDVLDVSVEAHDLRERRAVRIYSGAHEPRLRMVDPPYGGPVALTRRGGHCAVERLRHVPKIGTDHGCASTWS